MAGYEDTRQKIISTLMGRPVGTEIQPENQQEYELNMLDYIRGLELIATSTLIGIAEQNTTPVQPNNSRVCYIAGVAQNQTAVFENFIDVNGNPISITTGDMEGVLVILMWNTQYWSAQTISTNIISQAQQAIFYYNYNIRKTYTSVSAMNADVANPIGTDGKYIKVGDLVSVVNSTIPSENGFYSYEGADNGWKLQSGFNFQVEQSRSQNINTAPSSKLFDDEIKNTQEQINNIESGSFVDIIEENISESNCSYQNETSLFSGWGFTLCNKIKIQSLRIKVKNKSIDTTMTKVKFTLFKFNQSGAVLADKTIDVSIAPGAESYVDCTFDDLVQYSGLVYFLYRCDTLVSRFGWTSTNNYPFVPANDVSYGWHGYSMNGNLNGFLQNSSSTSLIPFWVKITGKKLDIETLQGNVTELQGNVTELQGNVTELQGNVTELQVLTNQFKKTDNYTIANFVDGYTQTYTKNIGDAISKTSSLTPMSSSSAAGQLVIPVKAGDNVIIKLKSLSNTYCRNWILTDSAWHILSWCNEGEFDWLTLPLIISIENDGYLFLHITQAYWSTTPQVIITHNCVEYVSDMVDFAVSESLQNINKIDVCVPDIINAVVGDTLQLYYRSIFKCVDPSKYAVHVECNIGSQYPRYFEVTPTLSHIGNHTLLISIKDNNNKILGTKTCSLVVKSVVSSPITNINILCLGASATEVGQWASEFKRRLIGSAGTPIANGLTNITFVGRMDKTYNGQQVNLEATGGYEFSSYTSINSFLYKFYFTTNPISVVNVGDIYTDGTYNYTISEINLSAGVGNISCTTARTSYISGVGTLTRVSGTGDATLTYSSSGVGGNPFVYNGAINMQQYANDFCNGTIDVIYTELFGNGTPAYGEDLVNRMTEMMTFITQARSAFPNVKFCIGLFWNPDIRGGMGINYGATGAWSDAYAIKFSNMNLCNQLQKYITDNNLSDYVYILNWLNEFDEENNMQQTTKKVNTRSSITEIFGVNGVHPSDIGYYQMADTAWRLFISKFCQ